jgi:hypothetical protein
MDFAWFGSNLGLNVIGLGEDTKESRECCPKIYNERMVFVSISSECGHDSLPSTKYPSWDLLGSMTQGG